MGNLRIFTSLLFAFTYYLLCSCKFPVQNNRQLGESASSFPYSLATLNRRPHTAFNADRFNGPARQKRSKKLDNFVEYPSTEVFDAPHPGFDRIPFNDYNRIVSALKEMLRARDEKTIILRPRPGRRSAGGDFPLWHYFIDDADNMGLDGSDTAAIVGDSVDALADTSLKKSAPFKPRLGKRGGSRICE
ncbi:uncharacterized protein LOC128854811 [Anastrepha ludens]|uniref:uncharacterized protein LOC128854811 n=1 Tax=Anastrepha ludens TaxID=28586 RepID=UPI0023B0EFE2|nr:uncharacterized protein LOC128854811 [Anastrepha ludens]